MGSTAFVLLCALASVAGAWSAWRHAGDARSARDDLRTQKSKLTAQEAQTEVLAHQLAKLRGQFFAFKKQADEREEDRDDREEEYGLGVEAAQFAASPTAWTPCENFKLAQVEGPQSKAASCECLYCSRQRRARGALRAALIPKTASGQAARTKEASHGQE